MDLNLFKLYKSQPYNLIVYMLYMTCTKFEVIWPHRLQDHNALKLKMNAEIFPKTHLEVKFDF